MKSDEQKNAYIAHLGRGQSLRTAKLEENLRAALQRAESAEQDQLKMAKDIVAARLENTRLRSALENTAPREDGDGLPCWCLEDSGTERYLRRGLFRIDHKGYCVNARAALKPETREVQ